jgi:hypothetical protein
MTTLVTCTHRSQCSYDFWKGLLIADIFIYVVYMTMGLVVYSFQGQYSFNPAYQGAHPTFHSANTMTDVSQASRTHNIGFRQLETP